MTFTFIVLLLAAGVSYEAPAVSSYAACDVLRQQYETPAPGDFALFEEAVVTSMCYAINRPADTREQREGL